jgi:hypothetical protein
MAEVWITELERFEPEDIEKAVWTTLPFAGDIKRLINDGRHKTATGVNGKRAISHDFGATWKLYRERRKFRRYLTR